MRATTELADFITRSPFARLLSVEIERIGPERRYRLDERDDLVGNILLPALHGGAVAAFLELCCAAELSEIAGLSRPPRPISINLQYVSVARQLPTFAVPSVRRVGKRVAVVHGEAFQGEERTLVCAAQCEFRLGDLG